MERPLCKDMRWFKVSSDVEDSNAYEVGSSHSRAVFIFLDLNIKIEYLLASVRP